MVRSVVVILVCLVAASCTGLNAKAIQPLAHDVADRHDQYVEGDTSLSDLEKTTALRSSKILVDTIDESAGK